MITSKIIPRADICNHEERKKVRTDKLIKSVLVVFIFSWIFLLQSCAIFVGGPGHGRHGFDGNRGHTEHDNRHH